MWGKLVVGRVCGVEGVLGDPNPSALPLPLSGRVLGGSSGSR